MALFHGACTQLALLAEYVCQPMRYAYSVIGTHANSKAVSKLVAADTAHRLARKTDTKQDTSQVPQVVRNCVSQTIYVLQADGKPCTFIWESARICCPGGKGPVVNNNA